MISITVYMRLLSVLHDHTQEAIVVPRYYDNQVSLVKKYMYYSIRVHYDHFFYI